MRNDERNEGAGGQQQDRQPTGRPRRISAARVGAGGRRWGEPRGGRTRQTAVPSLGQVRKPIVCTMTTWDKSPDHSVLQFPLGLSRAKNISLYGLILP